MSQIYPLSNQRHAGRYWKRAGDWSFAANRALVPIVHLELPRAVGEMPLAFVDKHLVAVLGTRTDKSLAVDEQGRWRPGHFPMLLATYPFVLADGKTVGVDEDFVSDTPGEPFFDDQGQPAEQVGQIIQQLKKIAASYQATQKAVQALAEHDLLEPWKLAVDNTRLEGLYRVSEARLRSLEPQALKSLLDAGAMAVAFAQLLSMAQVTRLKQWAEQEGPGISLSDDGELDIDWDKIKI